MNTEATDLSHIPAEWLEEFEAAARRPLEVRLRYAFIRTYKPVLDDAALPGVRYHGRLSALV